MRTIPERKHLAVSIALLMTATVPSCGDDTGPDTDTADEGGDSATATAGTAGTAGTATGGTATGGSGGTATGGSGSQSDEAPPQDEEPTRPVAGRR